MKPAILHTILGVALVLSLSACQRAHTNTTLPVLDWQTSPLDLNLRGMNGKSYLFRCPSGKPMPESITGTGVYTDASSICAAAAHAGAIDAQRGGLVMIQILPGQNDYRSTMQNFIHSEDYPNKWGGSFAVLSATDFDAGRKP